MQGQWCVRGALVSDFAVKLCSASLCKTFHESLCPVVPVSSTPALQPGPAPGEHVLGYYELEGASHSS